MLLKKINIKYIAITLIFGFMFLMVRLMGLGTDAINPDGVNWHVRSEQFVVGLKTSQLEKTHQHYHPGVTLMWVVGPTVEIIKQLFPDQALYTHLNFLVFHTFVKIVLVGVHLVLTLIILYLLTQVFIHSDIKRPFVKSLLIVSLFSFEPFFLGNSRLLHMDILLSLIMFIGLLFSYLAIKQPKWYYSIFAGGFLALAFLTKSIGIGGILFALGVGGLVLLRGFGKKATIYYLASVGTAFLIVLFAAFPALWVAPIDTLINIFDEAERVGIRKGHGQLFFGQYTRDPGVLFYLLVFVLKASPLILFGSVFYLSAGLQNLKEKLHSVSQGRVSLVLFLGTFYLGYLLAMTYPTKKLDRYMLPIFPYLALLSVLGYCKIVAVLQEHCAKYKRYFGWLLGAGVFGFIFIPLITVYPYYFTYTSPLVLNTTAANKIIGQKPFGMGIPKLKDHIFELYGQYPKLGFIDVKPMGAIYMNSKIFNIRVTGTNDYDLLVLGINEQAPDDILVSDTTFFLKDSSVYINGLEYWRIYVKQTQKSM